jgi:hypothetical protein
MDNETNIAKETVLRQTLCPAEFRGMDELD